MTHKLFMARGVPWGVYWVDRRDASRHPQAGREDAADEGSAEKAAPKVVRPGPVTGSDRPFGFGEVS